MKKQWLLYCSLFTLIFSASCKKEFSCENCTTSITGDTLFYYRVTVDNVRYEATAFQDRSLIITTIGWTQTVSRDSGCFIGSVLQRDALIPTLALSLEKGIVKNFSTLTLSDFQNFFKPGEYPYVDLKTVPPPSQFLHNGIAIRWVDETGAFWRSDFAPAHQTGSRFTIKKREDVSYAWTGGSKFPMRVVAQFNCNLYDSTGRSRIITNGELAFFFRKDF